MPRPAVDRYSVAFVAGIALLLFLAGFISYYDYVVFKNWVYVVEELGPAKLYVGVHLFGFEFRVVYPPLSPLVFTANYILASKLVSLVEEVASSEVVVIQLSATLHEYLERLVVKLPLVLTVIALWAYYARRYGRKANVFVLLGPPILIVMAVYNFDLFMVAAIVYSIYFATTGRMKAAYALLALASMFKQTALLALPVLAILTLKSSGQRALAMGLTIYVLVLAAASIPFVASSGLRETIELIVLFHSQRPPQGTTVLYSLYALSGYEYGLLKPYEPVWLAVFSLLYIHVLWRLARLKHIDFLSVNIAIAASFISYLVVGKVVNPVYMLWPYLFLVDAALLRGNLRLLKLYLAGFALVILHFSLLYLGSIASSTPVYIPEEKQWYSVRELMSYVYGSYGPYKQLADMIIDVVVGDAVNEFFSGIGLHWPLVSLLISLVYTVVLLRVYACLLDMLGGKGYHRLKHGDFEWR